jgi:hypothetical protein
MYTKYCIICGSGPVYSYCGHVIKGSRKIIAGVCVNRNCSNIRDAIMANKKGFCGLWKPIYGVIKINY